MASTVLNRIPVVGGLAYIEHVRALPATFNAVLSAEPDNRYFRQAIAVIANGGKAGYVAPEVAAGIFEQVRDSASPLTCPGRRAAESDHETSGVEILLDFTSIPLQTGA
ncbi:MAG: hypothetical protein M3541_04765 [Acidobacteriota bacterium]|nr:hypothetical protein [Acidobacteriota bacterium]